MSNPSESEVARFVTFLNPHPRTRSILPVELADDLWRIDLLGGVPRYPRVQRKRKREKGDTEGDTRERDFRQSIVVIRTGLARIPEVTAGITFR